MSQAQLDALYTAYVAAEDAEDYSAAIRNLRKMLALLAKTPNVSKSYGGSPQGIAWTANDILGLIAECRKAQTAAAIAAGGLFQTSKITYARATG